MKLNFWQILGLLLILVGAVFVIRKQMINPASPTTLPVMQPDTP